MAMPANWRTPVVVLLCGGIVVMLTFGIRQNFGLLLAPISDDLGWGRSTLAFAIALQNLMWGLSQPLAGGLADRYGAGKVVAGGGVMLALGLYMMTIATTPTGMTVSIGLLTGVAASFTGPPVILAVIARAVSPERRSLFLGIGSAFGTSGQLVIVPAGQIFIQEYGWVGTILMFSVVALSIVPLASALVERNRNDNAAGVPRQSVRDALREARRHRGFHLLILGFFVCGFQTMFIGIHLPSYLVDRGMSPVISATALALIGLFNMIGCLGWGALGGRYPKKYLLGLLYSTRSVLIAGFMLIPLSEVSVLVFASLIGLTWLGTVPLTSGIVAQIFGTRYMAMLYGFVFFNHQIGSFIGVWSAGVLYDRTGSYDLVWWSAVAVGFLAALVHWPIDDRAVPRLAAEAVVKG